MLLLSEDSAALPRNPGYSLLPGDFGDDGGPRGFRRSLD